MYKETVTPELLEILKSIQSNKNFEDFYLAGGTALALQIGHRQSIDLDFFTDKEFKSNLIEKLEYKYEVINKFDNSIEIFIDNNKVMFFYFSFKPYHSVINIDNIHMSNPVDIGLMKLLALQGRTTKKDIIDLFFIDKEVIKLEELLVLFENHYPKESFNAYSNYKELLNESDLMAQPNPKMLKEFDWENAYKVIQQKLLNHINNIFKK